MAKGIAITDGFFFTSFVHPLVYFLFVSQRSCKVGLAKREWLIEDLIWIFQSEIQSSNHYKVWLYIVK